MTLYYRITVKTFPFSNDMIQEIGCYKNQQTVDMVCQFLRNIHNNIDIMVNKDYNYDSYTNTIINDRLDRNEYQRLLDMKLKIKEVPHMEFKLNTISKDLIYST